MKGKFFHQSVQLKRQREESERERKRERERERERERRKEIEVIVFGVQFYIQHSSVQRVGLTTLGQEVSEIFYALESSQP